MSVFTFISQEDRDWEDELILGPDDARTDREDEDADARMRYAADVPTDEECA